MNMKNVKRLLLLLFISVLVACQSQTSEEEETEEKETVEEATTDDQEIHIAINAEPPTLDPQMTTAFTTGEIGRHMFETLLTLDSNYDAVPMLAESYEANEDNTEFIFHLREGVTFHNGEEMLAEDVVASMNRWKEKSSVANTTIGDAEFEEVDDYTVKIELDKPSSILINVMATHSQFAAIMPKDIIESAPAEGVSEYIGTGPYEFVEWQQDNYIHLTRYDDYQGVDSEPDGLSGKKEAIIKDLYFETVVDDSTRVAGIQTGEYDIAIWMPRDNYEQLESAPNVINSIDLYGAHNIIFNKKEGVMADPLMRQAFNAALDHDSIMLAAFSEDVFYRLDHGYMYQEQEQWYTDVGAENYNQKDKEKAKELLEEAGYDGEEIRILASRDYEHIYDAAIVIEEQLSDIMNVKVEIYDWSTLVEKRDDPSEYEIHITGFSTVTDPTQILAFAPDWPGWMDDPEIMDLMDEIREAESHEDAQAAFAQLQERNWNEYLSHIKLGDFYNLTSYQDYVEGLTYLEGLMLWNTTISK